MFNKILGTFGTKALTALINFAIVILTTQYLGPDGRGTVSLVIVTISVIIIFNNFVGGEALVYMASRNKLLQLLAPSYIWAIAVCTLAYFIMGTINIIPEHLVFDTCLISLIECFFAIHLMILLGKENIKTNNIISLVQVVIHVSVLLYLFVIIDEANIPSFINALYISYSLGLLVSFFALKKYFTFSTTKGISNVIKDAFKYGSLIQLANFAQFFNYRLSYYLLNYFCTTAAVGIYSVGVSISEAIWLIAGSISLVQYSRLSNTTDLIYSKELTLKLARLSLTLTVAALVPLLLFPGELFEFIFGEGFEEVRVVILLMAPGIASFGLGIILSHYFSGIGKYHLNAIASLSGLAITVLLGFLLIPVYGLCGAAATATLSYITSVIVAVWIFKKETGISLNQLIPNTGDFQYFFRQLKQHYVRDNRNS